MNSDLERAVMQLDETSRALRSRIEDSARGTSLNEVASLVVPLTTAGRFSDAIDYAERAFRDWDTFEPDLRNDMAVHYALALHVTGNRRKLTRFMAGPARSLSVEAQARIQIKSAWSELMGGDERKSGVTASSARQICDPEDSQLVLAELMYLEGYRSFSRAGDLMQAEEKIDLACSLFRLHSEQLLLAHALQARAEIHWGLGNAGYAESLATSSLRLAGLLGNYRTATAALRQHSIFCYHQAKFAKARALLTQALGFHARFECNVTPFRLKTEIALARLELLLGNSTSASETLEEVREHVPKMDAVAAAMWHEYQGIAKAQQLDYIAALASFEESKKCLAASGTTTYELAEVYWQEAEVHLAMHNPRIALDLANDALEVVAECGNRREYGQILRVKATALAQLARPQEAIPLLEEAAVELRGRNNPLELGRTLTQLAGVLDPESAVEKANEALAIFTRLQLSTFANEARQARDLARLRLQAFQSAEEKKHTVCKEGQLVAVSPRMKEVLADCNFIASSISPAVIMGATGVGKEVVARYIHEHSEFSKGPLVAVNCAALPESLFERELFGHKKGAFTGADRDTAGVVAAASGGTLFLDEIGELPMAMQAKLLRLLQESTYRRVGDVTEYHADIRVLAATNCDLRKQVDDKIFREDLWYRINAFEVRIPLLRERPEDIAPLTDLFLEEQSKKFGIEFWMDQQVRRLFERYPWPGNVRELQSAVRAGAARARGDGRIRVRHLPHSLRESRTKKPTPILSLQQHLEVEERRIILHALRQCKNSRSQAARYLGIGRNTLYEKMQRLGIALDKEAKG